VTSAISASSSVPGRAKGPEEGLLLPEGSGMVRRTQDQQFLARTWLEGPVRTEERDWTTSSVLLRKEGRMG